MSYQRAPKQWSLSKNETINSFENWKQNLIYTLSLDVNFIPYLKDDLTWQKKTSSNPNRGFTSDGEEIVVVANRRSATQKVVQLELMLGFIANYCPIISRNSIVKTSTSLAGIWQLIRLHFGFQSSGAQFLDLANFQLNSDERPEDLYQRLMAFIEDNLLTTASGIRHHDSVLTCDEELTPTIENIVVVLWLQLIHRSLPALVKQRFASELRNTSLASLKPEISMALDSLLDDIHSNEAGKILRSAVNYNNSNNSPDRRQLKKSFKSCILCKTAGRSVYNSHSLSQCKFLPDYDRKLFAKMRYIDAGLEDSSQVEEELQSMDISSDHTVSDDVLIDPASVRRVVIEQSPFLNVFHNQNAIKLTLDSGATANMIKLSLAKHINAKIKPASQSAGQADGVTPLKVIGEIDVVLCRNNFSFKFSALVVENLDVDALAGVPFMSHNDIAIRPSKNQIVIHGSDIVQYGTKASQSAIIRLTHAHTLRCPTRTTVLPGEYIDIAISDNSEPDTMWALEPRFDAKSNQQCDSKSWLPPQEILSVSNHVRITNPTDLPVLISKNEHFGQIRLVTPIEEVQNLQSNSNSISTSKQSNVSYSSCISTDPDGILNNEECSLFKSIHSEFNDVFNPAISKYNNASGKVEGVVNMGPVMPPQRKGRLPQYNQNRLDELQSKFDELESFGVFARPNDLGLLGGTRLVTSFSGVAQYCKPQPSIISDVDSVLRRIACWKFIIVSDLTKAYFQIPLSLNSLKYCGVVSPFKGLRVYTRCAMGLPGSEASLDNLMCLVLGNHIQSGFVAKLADNLFCGGKTPTELANNWKSVLSTLHNNNLRLSASQTVVCPKSTSILGWIWCQGSLSASPHRISALVAADPPKTVHAMRSYIGAFKSLSRVLQNHAEVLHPLELCVAGKPSNESITWNDDLLKLFRISQDSLSNHKSVTLPHPSDPLWIVTDASIKTPGIGSTLYVLREGYPKLAGFFNAKVKKHQTSWLPCEIEALAINCSLKHFAPYLIQSEHKPVVLTDSKPCVEAHNKLCRGEFSASTRISSYLSTVSRYQASVIHISGKSNIFSDYASRNPSPCSDVKCQICQFIKDDEQAAIRSISIGDVLSGKTSMMYTNRVSWLNAQTECPDLRRTHSYLSQGIRPHKKLTDIPDVKRYLQVSNIARDGLLVVNSQLPLQPKRERIIVPRSIIDGLITSIHLRLNHPSTHQMKQVVKRYFYALDLDRAIELSCNACYHCNSLKVIPTTFKPQSTSNPPTCVGSVLSADVMKRYKQNFLIIRETVTSFTCAKIIENEQHATLRDNLIILCSELGCLSGFSTTIRLDNCPSLICLINDPTLSYHGIFLDPGRVKNPNKNAIIDKCIRELGLEILNLSPDGGPISSSLLARAVANLNSRFRNNGLSSAELWTQRDQFTGQQLPIEDRNVIIEQLKARNSNHIHSAKSKAPGKSPPSIYPFKVGDLVYITSDGNKLQARERYIIIAISGEWLQLRKFIKSQFRLKVYDLHVSECYPVQPSILDNNSSQGPGNINMESDDDDDFIPSSDLNPCNTIVNSDLHITSSNTTTPVISHSSPNSQPTISNNSVQNSFSIDNSNSSIPRRSTRTNLGHPPSYLESYDCSSNGNDND